MNEKECPSLCCTAALVSAIPMLFLCTVGLKRSSVHDFVVLFFEAVATRMTKLRFWYTCSRAHDFVTLLSEDAVLHMTFSHYLLNLKQGAVVQLSVDKVMHIPLLYS